MIWEQRGHFCTDPAVREKKQAPEEFRGMNFDSSWIGFYKSELASKWERKNNNA
jgi:hypothetical protein